MDPMLRDANKGFGPAELFGVFFFFFILLCSVPIAFAMEFHVNPTMVLLLVVMCITFAGIPCLNDRHRGLGTAGIIAMLIFTVVGFHGYFVFIQPARAIENLRSVHNVLPSQPAVSHTDAVSLHFADGTAVDDTKAVGLKMVEGGAHTYCVAPILDDSQGERVEYWAIGVDCCEGVLSFNCGDAANPENTQGLVVPDITSSGDILWSSFEKYLAPPLGRRDLFDQAIKMAEATHGVTSATQPMMLEWKSFDHERLKEDRWARVHMFLIAVAVFAIVSSFILAAVAANPVGGDDRITAPTDLREIGVLLQQSGKVEDPQTWREIMTLGFLVPYLSFLAVLISWPFLFFFVPEVVYTVSAVPTIFAVCLLSINRYRQHGIFLLFVISIGVYVGRLNFYRNGFQYFSSEYGRTYTNVLATEKADAHADAGKIYFHQSAVLDRHRAKGYLLHGTTYCAAPIHLAGIHTPAERTAEFWAVGMNCCGKTGSDFECDDAKDSSAHGGVVFHDRGGQWMIMPSPYDHYNTAVQASAQTHHLLAPERPIFVRWARDPIALQEKSIGAAIGITVLSGVSALIVLVLATLGMFVYRARRMHRLQAEKDAQAQAQQAMQGPA
jgi:hypothetical protein